MKNLFIAVGIITIAWSPFNWANAQSSAALPTVVVTAQPTISQIRERVDELEARRTRLVEELDHDNAVIGLLKSDLAFIEDYQNSDASSAKPLSIVEAEHPVWYATALGTAASSAAYGTDFKLLPMLFSKFADSALAQLLAKFPFLSKTVVRRSVWVVAVPVVVYKVWLNYERHNELESLKQLNRTGQLEENKRSEQQMFDQYRRDKAFVTEQLQLVNTQLPPALSLEEMATPLR